jgi:hypothetical protein
MSLSVSCDGQSQVRLAHRMDTERDAAMKSIREDAAVPNRGVCPPAMVNCVARRWLRSRFVCCFRLSIRLKPVADVSDVRLYPDTPEAVPMPTTFGEQPWGP